VFVADAVVATHLFRIVEEAVQNALRHAAPKRVRIRLRRTRAGLLLTIWNNGRPLPLRLDATRGLGLRTMRYRAALLGGDFDLRRVTGGGTMVSCLIPDLPKAALQRPPEQPRPTSAPLGPRTSKRSIRKKRYGSGTGS